MPLARRHQAGTTALTVANGALARVSGASRTEQARLRAIACCTALGVLVAFGWWPAGAIPTPPPPLVDAPAAPAAIPAPEPTRPPRPATTPLETEVSDLGGNDRLPDALLPFYRPLLERSDPVAPSAIAVLPAPGQTLVLTYPLAARAMEVSPFGWRYSESRQAWRMHAGTDLIVPEGTLVRAALPGTVRLVQEVGGYGLTVVIDHGRGWQTLYAHLLDLAVRPSQELTAGEPIGRVGSTGQASTAHLHFELRRRQDGRTVALDAGPLLEVADPPLVAGQPQPLVRPVAVP